MNQEKVGKRIQECREKAGISQETLAEVVGISVTSISNIERGKYYPTLANFIKIANALRASADTLLFDVIEVSYPLKITELSERLEKMPLEPRRQLIKIIDTLIDIQKSGTEHRINF